MSIDRLFASGWLVCGLLAVWATNPASADGPKQIDFGRDVQPTLRAHCYVCLAARF